MNITVLDRCTVTAGDISFAPIEKTGNVTYYDTLPQSEVAKAIGNADAVVVNKAKITAEVMDACPNLRFVGLFATAVSVAVVLFGISLAGGVGDILRVITGIVLPVDGGFSAYSGV